MEITFLLGNGFDIQCGLKTSYIDFYKYILEKKYSIDLNKVYGKAFVSEIDNIIYREIYKSRDKIETWADLEFQLGVFTKQLQKQNKDVEELSNRFLDDFETLLEDLNDYLKSVQIQDDVKIKEDFSDVLYATMNSFFKGVLQRENDELNKTLKDNFSSHFNYRCISFNYTNTLKKVIQGCSEVSMPNRLNSSSHYHIFDKKIINVHGVIDKFLTLGLNDETQLATDFFDMTDLNDLIKPKSLENNREYMRRDAENLIDKSDIIVIFGMSIGATDKHWWEKIAYSLMNSKNKKLIIHLYEKTPSFLSSRKVRIRRESKENDFLSHLDNLDLSDEQIAQLRKQIYIVTNSEYILNVDLRQYLNTSKSDKVIDIESKDASKVI